MYKVLCTVQGGATGYHLKGYNGREQVFVTREEAKLVADGLQFQRNSYPNHKATFTYVVVEA